MRSVDVILALVVVATVVAAFAERLRVPPPSLLVLAGLAAGLVPGVPRVEVTPQVVSLVVLPPLLYAAGQEVSLRDLRAVWRPVAVLATGLVLASAAAVAAVVRAVTPLPASMAFVLGAVLASTDPVAVSALGRRLPLPARLQALVQAESLFNDATSLVLFQVAVSFAVGTAGPGGWARGIGQFAVLAVGGAAAGAVLAGGVALVRRRIADPVLETVAALVTPYAAYVLAETLGVSGVTAVVVASVILSSRTVRLTTAQSRLQLHSVYQTVVFLLESVVFALIGLELPALIGHLRNGGSAWPAQALAVAVTLLAVRALWVLPVLAAGRRPPGRRRPWREAAVVSWAGARGVVPLAAALSIPLTAGSGAPLPGRDLVLVLAAAVIVASLLAQGLTLEPLVRGAGIARPAAAARHEATLARLRITEAGLSWLEQLAVDGAAPDDMIDRLRRNLQARSRALEDDDGVPAASGSDTARAYTGLRRGLLTAQRDELTRLHADGEIGDATRRRIQRQLDLEEAGLSDG